MPELSWLHFQLCSHHRNKFLHVSYNVVFSVFASDLSAGSEKMGKTHMAQFTEHTTS